ncbi:MAG TPA: tetratricopeptide repeat protein [Gemmatimonadales bacterium]|nr:tetratricopeptide repeat protein [Gemmatimonadales bacterium]
MRTRIVTAVTFAAAVNAAPLIAQTVNDRVVKGMPSKFAAPTCGIKAGHFKVQSGATYLKTGIETEVPENQTRALNNGKKVLLEALEQNQQEKNPALWYYLGRIYLQQGDIVGADTALTRAETLLPACKKDISDVRYVAWVPLVNAGIAFNKEEKNDSALALYRQASTIYRDKPLAFLNAGVIFANANQVDSAIYYFQKASQVAEQTNAVEDRNAATRNWGALLQRSGRHKEAIPVLEKYVGWAPKDVEVKRALASSYRATGQNDKAKVIEDEVGVAAGAPGPSAAAGASADAMSAAVTLYNDKKYAEAAAAFEKVLATEPNNRDALYGLANAYVGLKSPKLADAAARLVAIEPVNDEAVRLLANGQRMAKKETLANKTAIKLLAMPTSVKVSQFAPTADGASITATATGREGETAQGKPLVAKPLALIFEFLDAQGAVVANQEVQVPALKAGETHPIEVKVQGPGIAAWRYKQK